MTVREVRDRGHVGDTHEDRALERGDGVQVGEHRVIVRGKQGDGRHLGGVAGVRLVGGRPQHVVVPDPHTEEGRVCVGCRLDLRPAPENE